ncbi:MAG: DUF3883 domain-containing protein [Deltaproteobacteria bacterium]|nr:DUF3883 domain-containing protein [Deltaproteobacteria bacterium]
MKGCPIFPIRDGEEEKWGAIEDDVMWIRSNSPEAKAPKGIEVVDPSFTYNPGRRAEKNPEGEKISRFNSRFRDFVTDKCNIPLFSDLENIRRKLIPDLKKLRRLPDDPKERKKVNQIWMQIYRRFWKRRDRIRGDEGEDAWNQVRDEIPECNIPVRRAGEQDWQLAEVGESFLGPRFLKDVDLTKLYEGTQADIIDLEYLEEGGGRGGAETKEDGRIDWDDWREFLVECGAKTGPYLDEHDPASNSEYLCSEALGYGRNSGNFGKAIRDAISQTSEYSRDGSPPFCLKAGSKTYRLDPFTEEILKEDQKNDYLTRRLSNIWPEAEEKRTLLRFTLGGRKKVLYTDTNVLLLHQQLSLPLKVLTDKGLRCSSETYDDTPENRRLLDDLVPYVNCASRKYNRELLVNAGMRERVDVSTVLMLIAHWYESTPATSRIAEGFSPYLRMVTRFARSSPAQLRDLRARLKLYDPGQDELVPWDKWRECARNEYSPSLSYELLGALQSTVGASADDIVKQLIRCSPLEDHEDDVGDAIVCAGRFSEAHGDEELADLFRRALAKGKVRAFGKKVTSPARLPILWDKPPIPSDGHGGLRITLEVAVDEMFRRGREVLGWRAMSGSSPKLELTGRKSKLDECNAGRVFRTISELLERLGDIHPRLQKKVQALGLFSSPTSVANGIVLVDDIGVRVKEGSTEVVASVPYWFSEREEVLHIQRGYPLHRALPEFVDLTYGTQFGLSFHYFWEAQKAPSRLVVDRGGLGAPRDPATESAPSGGEGRSKRLGEEPLDDDLLARAQRGADTPGASKIPDHPRRGGSASSEPDRDPRSEAEGGLDDEEEWTGEGSGGRGNGPRAENVGNGKQEQRRRGRLCSVVISERKPLSPKEREEKQARRKEVEDAGRKHMKAYLERLGAKVFSRESEKIGYDFDVTVGNETFYVELKASEYRWDGWEEALSRNEFLKARELREEYFLCVVDRALSEDWSIYFIKDPVGEVAYYLFDHPWKAFSEDMKDHVDRLKAQQGIPED